MAKIQRKGKLPKIFSKDQIIRTLKKIDDPTVAMGMFLGLFQGLRISEITYDHNKNNTALKWEDVDLQNGHVLILDAKNPKRFRTGYGKDRIVPIFDEFLHLFKMWKAMNPEAKYVLPHNKNNEKCYAIRDLQKNTNKALERAELQEIDYYQVNGTPRYKYHFHTFRHACATNLLRRGMKIEHVKEFLGHEKLDTTMVYLDIVKDDLKEALTIALAYPKQRNYFLPQNPDKLQQLRLENENLRLKLQLQQEVAHVILPQ